MIAGQLKQRGGSELIIDSASDFRTANFELRNVRNEKMKPRRTWQAHVERGRHRS